jgi:DNA-binding GntR family transcriptional regulator
LELKEVACITSNNSKSQVISSSFQQQAYNFIKTRIMTREFKPNQLIADTQIAAELGISRTPVREALQLLKHEGLIIRQAKRGWKVYTLLLHDIDEIFDIKVELESMIARHAAGCKDEEKKTTLHDALGRMQKATESHDHEAWREADMDLHHTILEMSGNKRASRIINDLNNQWYRVRIGLIAMEGRIERSIREHEAVVASILAGNGAEAEQQMRSHLNNLRQELVRVLLNLVLPFVEHGI